jgi:histidine triad (HIT) family protein
MGNVENCIFCKIINGNIPSYKVWEDENCLAFLTIQPIKKGHTLVIPKKHLPYIFEMEDADLSNLILVSKKVSKILKKAMQPKSGKIGVMVYGIDVPHTHVHLVPIDKPGDLSFKNQKNASSEELQKTLEVIKEHSKPL